MTSTICAPIDPATIPENSYVTISPDGHLQLEGKRVRYWGWIGHFNLEGDLNRYRVKKEDSPDVRKQKIENTYRVYDGLAQRIHDLGFNLVRMWPIGNWCTDYTPGDGSDADFMAFSLNALNKRGIKVWMTAFGQLGPVTPDDATIISDPATEKAWKDAVSVGKMRASHNMAYGWDERLLQIAIKRMQNIAAWPNKYKDDLRLGDDPQFAVWELTNEEWWLTHMINGHWQKDLPAFFRVELQNRWCEWLQAKYKNDAGLIAAWKFVLPGESLTKKSIGLLPLASRSELDNLSDANQAAIDALTADRQKYSRDDFVRQRGADVLEFLTGLHVKFKSRQRDAARAMGRGLARVPIIFDTGDHFRIQSIFLHQQGDAVSMCTYIWQIAGDKQQPRFPWVSGLDELPRTAMGIPWAECGRVPGKPFFVYETQTNNPSKYRAEFPYRMAATAAIQDWDIVCWHLFGRPDDPDSAKAYNGALHLSRPGMGVEGVHFKNDEVEASAMKAAGAIFINGALKSPLQPTVMTFGRKSMYDPQTMDYGKSFGDLGQAINSTVYRYGCYMQVDTSKENDVVKGPILSRGRGIDEANPVQPTSEISFDYRKGNLVFDSPAAVSYTGFFGANGGPVVFSNGIKLDKVTIVNPDSMPYPVTESERYIAMALVAQDGKPLGVSKNVLLSLVSTSFNNGFALNSDSVARGKAYDGMKFGGDKPGKPNVLIARVGAQLSVPMLKGMKYIFKDWHFNTVGEGVVKNGILIVPADKPVFYAELTR